MVKWLRQKIHDPELGVHAPAGTKILDGSYVDCFPGITLL